MYLHANISHKLTTTRGHMQVLRSRPNAHRKTDSLSHTHTHTHPHTPQHTLTGANIEINVLHTQAYIDINTCII